MHVSMYINVHHKCTSKLILLCDTALVTHPREGNPRVVHDKSRGHAQAMSFFPQKDSAFNLHHNRVGREKAKNFSDPSRHVTSLKLKTPNSSKFGKKLGMA